MAAKPRIFQHISGDTWPKPMVNERKGTALLDEKIEERLLQDVRDRLDRSIPYRYYLLHGPSGTGKTCLAFSIAARLALDIYVLRPCNDMETLVAGLPGHCVILLKDVETASPSELLDLIARIGHGQIFIMTTHHIERLDGALDVFEPGRLVKAEFQLADREVVTRLFRLVFQEYDETEVDRLATQFAAKIPELEFSPAEVSVYLIDNRRSPQRAVDGTEAWVARAKYGRNLMQGGA